MYFLSLSSVIGQVLPPEAAIEKAIEGNEISTAIMNQIPMMQFNDFCRCRILGRCDPSDEGE